MLNLSSFSQSLSLENIMFSFLSDLLNKTFPLKLYILNGQWEQQAQSYFVLLSENVETNAETALRILSNFDMTVDKFITESFSCFEASSKMAKIFFLSLYRFL